MKRVVITGGTGAVGTGLIESCVKRGIEVYVLIRPDTDRKNRINQSDIVKTIPCDIRDYDNFDEKSIPKVDVFYHFGWIGTHGTDVRNQMDNQISNIQYTINAVRLAARLGCETFIGAGTQAEYGRVEGILSPDTPCKPENGYGIAKYAAGCMSRIECGKLGLKHIWARIVSTYGPRDGANSLVTYVINECLKGHDPLVTKAEQLWDYLYSEDAGDAFRLMGENGKDGAIYVLASGTARKLREFIEIICKETAPNIHPQFGAKPYMDKQVMHLEADISALKIDLGFNTSTDFETGIRKTIEWERNNRR